MCVCVCVCVRRVMRDSNHERVYVVKSITCTSDKMGAIVCDARKTSHQATCSPVYKLVHTTCYTILLVCSHGQVMAIKQFMVSHTHYLVLMKS